MAITVKVGAEVEVKKHNAGASVKTKKPWEMFILKDNGKGHKDVTLWATNIPTNYQEGQKLRIESIESFSFTADQYKNVWRDRVICNCTVTPTGEVVDPNAPTFEEMTDEFGDVAELPF